MIKAILFDLDNTLLDFMQFKKETAKSAAKAMVEQGIPATEKEIYGKIFSVYQEKGIEYQKTFYEVVAPYSLEPGQAERIQQAGIIAYLKRKFEVLKPYPEVKPTLEKLRKKGLKLGIVTDAPRNKAWQRLIMAGLENEFDFVITYNDTMEFKPHPSPFKLALARLNDNAVSGSEVSGFGTQNRKLETEPDEVLFVGDHPGKDVKGAKAMGMKTALAQYGQHFRTNDEADYVIKKFEELLELAK